MTARKDGSCLASWSKTEASTTWSSRSRTACRTTCGPASPKRWCASRSGSTRRAERVGAAALAVLASACSYPTNTSPYPGDCTPLQPVAFVPAPNGVAVPTDVEFRITFNDYPDPDTVRSDSLLLTTGYFWVPGNYGVDLIGKAAVMRPIRPLSTELGYAVHLRPALAALSGCPGTSVDLQFMTGDGGTGVAPPPTPSLADDVQ